MSSISFLTLIVVLLNLSQASSGPVCPRSFELPIPTMTKTAGKWV